MKDFDSSRRSALVGSASLAAAAAAAALPAASATAAPAASMKKTAAFITTRDGVDIYYKDWGPRNGQPIVFSHGWPLSSDSWESQMFFLANQGMIPRETFFNDENMQSLLGERVRKTA